MRILLANHTAACSGAEVSLLRLIQGLKAEHDLAVACPGDGALATAIENEGISRFDLRTVDLSLRLHPTQTPRGLTQLAAGAADLTRAARGFGAEVIHANTIRTGLLATVPSGSRPPIVVRAHEAPPASAVGRAVRAAISRSAAAVAAVSDHTTRLFNEGLRNPVAVRVYNSVDHHKLDPDRVVAAPLREELGIDSEASLLGQIAQITPWKDQATAIRVLGLLRRKGIDAHLVIVGQVAFSGKRVRYDNNEYLRELKALIDELDVTGAVHFTGQRADVPSVLKALDLSLLPSWEEPFGLATVESMAMGTPPLVTNMGAGPELVADGVCGRLLPPREPEEWAQAAEELLRNAQLRAVMGDRARAAAAPFRDEMHAREMVGVYRSAIIAARSRRRRSLAPQFGRSAHGVS